MEATMDTKPVVLENQQMKQDNTPTILPHDSMVTVRLSDPPPNRMSVLSIHKELPSLPKGPVEKVVGNDGFDTVSVSSPSIGGVSPTTAQALKSIPDITTRERRGSESEESEDGEEVNWAELERTEEKEPRDQGSDDSTALLLARLEQENNLLVTNPKSGLVKVQSPISPIARVRRQSRPPSMQQLKRLVHAPTPSALRYSLNPPPPMTDLEFYAALVQDYTRTAQCLPTLLSKKIRSGIPPPLRGVVWQSMSGARDSLLEEQYDQLCGESSPYEGMIGKDIGRSFPGVEMFREPEGDGQRMLGRVLKCFSLYDHKIGYCQGLGFLVGPLLMHMGDKQAFCVLVRLMEHYDLRSCFLPDLSGLHVRIFQFRELLKQHLPKLYAHLEVLQIDAAYVSQWFLSFFAVTCPLPMLFRIYDVIFAEGASVTIMRVALSLMRKNEAKILATTEFEDVMQLLLSRGLWDCYHYNADEFVNDFVSLANIVTNDGLQNLALTFQDSQAVDASAVRTSDIGSAAARFLGRLWAGSGASTKSTNLSPSVANRPVSFLRRSPSKQSIASTLNSVEGGTDSILSTTSTDATSISRESSNVDVSSIRVQSQFVGAQPSRRTMMSQDKDLHSQIEDLLTALSEMQRDHALLASQLQREREEREEDRYAVRSLIDGLRKKSSSETVNSECSEDSSATVVPRISIAEKEVDEDSEEDHASKDREIASIHVSSDGIVESVEPLGLSAEELHNLLEAVDGRFAPQLNNARRCSVVQTKVQLRDDLIQSQEQVVIQVSKCQDLSRRLMETEQEASNLRDQLRDAHAHIRNAHQEKQRLEKSLQEHKARKASTNSLSSGTDDSDWSTRSSNGGLRELKLGRANSTRSTAPSFTRRTSSLVARSENDARSRDQSPPGNSAASYMSSQMATPSAHDTDVLLLELAQAKTAEAVARQEMEETKGKLEALRKMLGKNMGAAKAGPEMPMHGMERAVTVGAIPTVVTPASGAAGGGGGGGFWGGWGKRAVSTSEAK